MVFSSNLNIFIISNNECHECRIMVPRLKKIQKNISNLNIRYFEANKENIGILREYNITVLPTILFLDKNNNELSRLTRLQTEKQLKKEIQKWKNI